ncbi:MAG: serine/threonine protein kinase, partial [Chitinophagaceae bacterium]|nr:serine/threonine protein kinase [Rubrivivax sp.]
MANSFGIDAPTWARLNPLLEQALDLSPAERVAWLQALPAPFADLRDTLADLLSRTGGGETAALLVTMPKLDDDDAMVRDGLHAAGDVVGPYRLVRELGVGGMGAVWLADRVDGLMQRSVALKLPYGPIHGPFRGNLAARIAREREIVATLDHPNIARLHDAGIAADGQPYLALEYVDGQRIDRYCETQQLDVAARLRLFMQAAHAVSYAHAQLVVHRDIKPSNLMVDTRGQVKLLDFGIAKLLTDGLQSATAGAPELTQQGMRALTPDYASPEQLAGLPVGTRSDVYSLGVLLFELLTGVRPYGTKRNHRAALEEALAVAEVPRPSDLVGGMVDSAARRRALRGDLDTIVAKALKKPLEERYASVEALAADVRRHLDHEPVLARPDSTMYRLRKFMRRRRAAVGAWAAVTLALLAGSGLALWQAREARQERNTAVQAQQRAESERSAAQRAERAAIAEAELSGFLMMEMAPTRTNDELALVLDRARRMFDTQYSDDPALRGKLLLRMGSLFNGRGDRTRSHALWAEAEPLLRDKAQWSALAEMQCSRATEMARRGQLDTARTLISEAKQLLVRDNALASPTHLHCLTDEAVIERTAGNAARAASLLEQAVENERQAGRDKRADFAELLNTLARSHYDAGR